MRPFRARKALLCTLGPSSLDPRVIPDLEGAGVTSFRINMSHTEVADLERLIRFVRSHTRVPICLDTRGAQMRTGPMEEGVVVREDSYIRLTSGRLRGNASTIPITPGEAVSELVPGTRMSIDFDSVIVRVDRIQGDGATARVLTGGEIGSRKAVTAYPSPRLPTFSEEDVLAIQIALRNEVHEFALSFCEHPDAVIRLRQMVGPDDRVIAKVESRVGVRNLDEIATSADAILIDRGDLSREVRLGALPLLQKAIIRRANELAVPVYVATNLLESMVTRRAPTRAEVNDVINSLLDGADGLVLAAETAVGRYPVLAARMIATLLREYESLTELDRVDRLLGEHPLASDPTSDAGPAALPAPAPATPAAARGRASKRNRQRSRG